MGAFVPADAYTYIYLHDKATPFPHHPTKLERLSKRQDTYGNLRQ